MGLDMYLRGVVHHRHDDVRGALVESIHYLGYWRKHPNLHGYIVREFAGGKDECQKIDLLEDGIKKIIKAVKEDNLPFTQGFFFGATRGDEKERDLEILHGALEWLKETDPPGYRYVYYQASW